MRATASPNYPGLYLPTMIATALGVALCLPQLSSAAVQSLPADQFGAGSAVGQAVRNFGATLGVAIVIALIAGASGPSALGSFRHLWWVLVACGVTVSIIATRVVRSTTTAR